jgi:rubrerythrin
MMTSREWWAVTRSDASALGSWLRDQYRGEATAAVRIEMLRDAFAAAGTRAHRVLTVIAAQERKHASWVGELLAARGQAVVVEEQAERYWPQVVGLIADLETGAAVGAHAERMRLERIEVIAEDSSAPDDVRRVFAKILPEERFHERAFRALAGDAALQRTASAHALGREALGLSA